MGNDGQFKKGKKPIPHKKGCKCFRCNKMFWQGRKHTEETKKKITEIQRLKSPFVKYESKEWFMKKYWEEKKSYSQIAKEIGASQGWVQKWMEKFNIPRRTENFSNPKYREKNGRWNGGIYYRMGYKFLYNREHPNRSKSRNYITEHTLVMSEYLKRPLKNNETVHHLNGNKLDNRIENLLLIKGGQKEHQQLEQKILLFAKQIIWGELKPEFKKELQKLFDKFTRE